MTRLVDSPSSFMPGDPVVSRLTTIAKKWTPVTYRHAAKHMKGWHWVETASGHRACVHGSRVRRA